MASIIYFESTNLMLFKLKIYFDAQSHFLVLFVFWTKSLWMTNKLYPTNVVIYMHKLNSYKV